MSARAAAVLLAVVSFRAAAELVLLPAEIVLHRQGLEHRVLALQSEDGAFTGDVSRSAVYESSNPAVATVDASGVVTALGNGEAVITASAGGERASAAVRVVNAAAPAPVSFQNAVQPLLFRMGCSTSACHGAAAGKNGFRLSLRGFDHDWDHKGITRQAAGRRISIASPSESLLLLKPTMAVAHEGGERFTAESKAYRILERWIREGAPPADPADPEVSGIEVLPERVTLPPSAEQQFLVRAHYTDGTSEDVTAWAKFGTTNDSVVLVNDDGMASVLAPGAGAITVYFASKVASAEVLAPRGNPVPSEVYSKAERRNFIDSLILERLEQLQIPPAQRADDAVFVRRAYLDALGVLPTPEETVRFRDDPSPDKHARLIDALLGRPEFADYWTSQWSDLLLVSSKNLTRPGELNAFHGFIRENVERNTPWDQFVRDIVTAKGNTLDNGAAAYFLMHKDITDLTETTSQAFLGMSITCARCHNHPLEKWTQDDYYGMANLLSRVKIKNGRQEGSNDILAADFGDLIHPRYGKALPPRPLDGEPLALDTPGDRREQLARWLTSPENVYFTRAIANRVWANFMGRGLVEPVDDLRLTNPPTNAELLGALANDFAEHGFDVKHLIRAIMNSAAYQRSAAPPDPAAPDDRFYSHYISRRLKAEVILDAYAIATGVSTDFPGYPEGYRALQLRDSQVASYFLTAFGRPERRQTCTCERTEDPSLAQTLHLANGDTLNAKLRAEQGVLAGWIRDGISDQDLLHRLFMRCLSRYPSARELDGARAMLAAAGNAPDPAAARAEVVQDIAWAILSGKEFLFNH